MSGNSLSYRWQDHIVTPQHGVASMAATALIVLLVGAAVMFSVVGSTPPPAPATHVTTEQTPPLTAPAKRPIRPRATETWR